jgi:hypothetical protein
MAHRRGSLERYVSVLLTHHGNLQFPIASVEMSPGIAHSTAKSKLHWDVKLSVCIRFERHFVLRFDPAGLAPPFEHINPRAHGVAPLSRQKLAQTPGVEVSRPSRRIAVSCGASIPTPFAGACVVPRARGQKSSTLLQRRNRSANHVRSITASASAPTGRRRHKVCTSRGASGSGRGELTSEIT